MPESAARHGHRSRESGTKQQGRNQEKDLTGQESETRQGSRVRWEGRIQCSSQPEIHWLSGLVSLSQSERADVSSNWKLFGQCLWWTRVHQLVIPLSCQMVAGGQGPCLRSMIQHKHGLERRLAMQVHISGDCVGLYNMCQLFFNAVFIELAILKHGYVYTTCESYLWLQYRHSFSHSKSGLTVLAV